MLHSIVAKMTPDQSPPDLRETSPNTAVPWGPRDLVHGIGLMAAATAVTIVLLSLAAPDDGASSPVPLITLAFATVPLVLVSAAWLFGVRRYQTSWSALGLVRAEGAKVLLLPLPALFLSLFLTGLYASLVRAVGAEEMLPPPFPSGVLGEGIYRTMNTISIGIVGPLAEEIFFRGFLLGGLIRPLGVTAAVVVSSVIFAVNHGDVSVMVPVFISGVLLAWVYVRTGSVWPSFVAHAGQNLIALAVVA